MERLNGHFIVVHHRTIAASLGRVTVDPFASVASATTSLSSCVEAADTPVFIDLTWTRRYEAGELVKKTNVPGRTVARRSHSMKAFAIGLLVLSQAAQAADLTVTAVGGSWEKAYRQCFVEPFEKKTGKSVDVILGSALQWVNQVAANPQKPPIDVLMTTPDAVFSAMKQNLVEPISAANVPNMAQLDPRLIAYGHGYGFPVTYGDFGLMYSKKRVANPPKTWKEFVDGTVAGKWQAALPDINYVGTPAGLIMLFTHVYGGSPDDIQPALNQIKRMRDSNNATFFSDPNEPLGAMRSGDIDIAMYYDGRAWVEHDTTNPDLAWINPAPGSVAFPNMAAKVKNGSPLGYQFLNELASADGQSCFANAMQYTASNTQVKYSDKVRPRIATVANSIWINFDDIGNHVQQWIESWNKQIGR